MVHIESEKINVMIARERIYLSIYLSFYRQIKIWSTNFLVYTSVYTHLYSTY